MKIIFRTAAILISLSVPFGPPASAAAESWPARTITLIVPFPAGGTTDIVARSLGQKLSDALHQPVVIDNRGGGGGTLGAAVAAKAAPDGYTFFISTIAHAIATSLYKQLPYDFEKDFIPITVIASVPNIVIVHPSVPVNSVKELIDYAKANPGKLNYGSAGNGSTEHLSAELFKSMAGVQMTHVPYKGGAPMMTDLLGGQIQIAIETSGSALPHVRGGKVRALAVTTATRSPALPDVPTVSEAGLVGYEMTTWYGILAPKGTPKEIVAKINQEVRAILKSPEMKKRLDEIGAEPGGISPDQFAAFIKSEIAKWAKLVKQTGATVD